MLSGYSDAFKYSKSGISGTGNKGRVSGHARLEYGADILSGCNKAAGRTDDFRWLKGDKGFWQTQQI